MPPQETSEAFDFGIIRKVPHGSPGGLPEEIQADFDQEPSAPASLAARRLETPTAFWRSLAQAGAPSQVTGPWYGPQGSNAFEEEPRTGLHFLSSLKELKIRVCLWQ